MPALNFSNLKRRVMVLTGQRCDNLQAGILINQKFIEWSESYSWSWLKAQGVLATVAPKTAGTVALNADTTKIDGTGTAFAATDVDSYIRVAQDVAFYRITAVSAQQLTLERAYVGSSFTGQASSVFRHIYALASDFRRMVSPAFWSQLQELTLSELDLLDPRRTAQGDVPTHFAYRGLNSSNVQEIELWPVPSAAVVIRYQYLKTIAEATAEATVLPIAAGALCYSAAADALRIESLKKENAAIAQALLKTANDYDLLGLKALEEAKYADVQIAGIPQSIIDAHAGGVWNDEFALSHDLWSPVR